MTLETMNLTTLRREYERVFGPATRAKSKDYLRKRISARRSELARERGARRGEGTGPAERDPRLPEVGRHLERTFDGKVHRVTVLKDGFAYRGKSFTSLSSVARTISGTNWNGYGFFGLLASAPREQREGA